MNTPSPSPTPTPKKTPAGGASADGKKDAADLLKADHREVDELFSQFKSAKGRQKRRQVVEQIATALIIHTMIEEEIFYPACQEKGVEEDELDEAQVEHDTVKLLVRDLLDGSVDDDYYDAKVTVLSEYVKHHVREEEEPSDGIFARAQTAGVDMEGLGEKLQTRKDELKADERRLRARPLKIRSLKISPQPQESSDMARYPIDRHRDEENRYGGDYDRNPDRRSRGYDDYRASNPGPRESLIGNRGRADDQGDYRSGPGGYGAYPDMHDGHRHGIEQSGSGGRYRTYYGDEQHRQDGGYDDAQRSHSARGYRFRDASDDVSHDDYGRGGRYAGGPDYRGDHENDSDGRYASQGGEDRGGYGDNRGDHGNGGRGNYGQNNRGGYGNADRNSGGNNRGYPYGSR